MELEQFDSFSISGSSCGARPKAYSYLRFSTPEQIKGDSLRRQLAQAADYARKHDLDLVDSNYRDLGVSAFRGMNAEVGMLGEFLQAVRDGAIPRGSFLLVESLDRISRDKARRAVKLVERICDEGITLVTLNDGRRYDSEVLDEDPLAPIWMMVVAMRAHEESVTKSKRLKAAWAQKRALADRIKLTAKAPSWLRLNPDRKQFDVIEPRADVVRRIYAMAANGYGRHQIVKVLNSEHVPTFERAKRWHASFIARVLQNQAVLGRYTPNEIEFEGGRKRRRALSPVDGYYPAIVPQELWARVRLATAKGASIKGRCSYSNVVNNIFAGMASCALCGAAMSLCTKSQTERYLVCMAAKSGAGCKYKPLSYYRAEMAFLAEFDAQSTIETERGSELADEQRRLESQIKEVATKVDALLATKPLSSTLRQELATFNGTLTALEEETTRIREERASISPTLLQEKAAALATAAREQPIDRLKVNSLIRQLAARIEIDWSQSLLNCFWRSGARTEIRICAVKLLRR